MIKSTTAKERTILDRTREPWVVEEVGTRHRGKVLVRYRHELGYELLALAPRPVGRMADPGLVRLLEAAKRRVPRDDVSAA